MARRKEPDPIAVVMAQQGKTRLQVLLELKEALARPRHASQLAADKRTPQALANLDAMIEAARKQEIDK